MIYLSYFDKRFSPFDRLILLLVLLGQFLFFSLSTRVNTQYSVLLDIGHLILDSVEEICSLLFLSVYLFLFPVYLSRAWTTVVHTPYLYISSAQQYLKLLHEPLSQPKKLSAKLRQKLLSSDFNRSFPLYILKNTYRTTRILNKTTIQNFLLTHTQNYFMTPSLHPSYISRSLSLLMT